MTGSRIPLGVGLYTRAEAARLLRMHPQRITRWVKGYSYSWEVGGDRHRGRQPPIITTDLPRLDGVLSLSFLELMELRVVQEFLKAGVALQTVRVAWGHARRVFQTRHPFADQRLFVAKGQVFAAVDTTRGSTPDLLEISSRTQPWQTVAGPILAQTVKAVEFDEQSRRVRRWWPLGPSQPIVLDPTIAFGAPVVQRTRVRTTILAHHAAHIPVAQLARAYELSTADVEAAVNFEVQLAA